MKCKRCKARAVVALPSHNAGFCEECFLLFFSRQVERAVKKHAMFTLRERVLVALSGGKDSLALIHRLASLGQQVTGLHVDLGIPGSSAPARRRVEDFCAHHGFDLHVVELEREGLPIPEVKKRLRRPVCSVCGKIKRYYFNKHAMDHGFDVLATGHNLDDEVSRLFANTLRWDVAYLSDQGPRLDAEAGFARKVKPFYRLSEFEIANYCFLAGIDYHQAPCPYSAGASFTGHKRLWADLEDTSPGQKLSFYESFLKAGRPAFQAVEERDGAQLAPCDRCGYPTSAELCGVCRVRAQLHGQG
jgi:uncharacterized protein (TIGR00269 family)